MAEKVHSLDPESTMAVLKDNVITAVGSYFPFQGRTRVLEAEKIYAVDTDIDVDDVESQKNAKFRGRTWSQPIYGDFVLRDKVSGDVVAKATKVPVANLPHITRRYSYIVDGSEYQADSQWRLMSGAYSRVKANGELETQFNLSKGRGFRVQFDPEKKDVTLQYGAAFIPAYPVLRALGVSDDELKKSWGSELVDSVSQRTRKGALLRLAKILDKRATATTDEQAVPVIAQQLDQSKLNPEIMGITLGKEFDRVTPEAIVLATNKLIKINKGEAQPDERDSILFKELWNISDHMPERILNSKMALTAKLRNNVDRKDNIREIVTSDLFNIPIKTFFTSSSLAQQTSQTNPVDMLGNHLRTTLMGTGGIGSENAISLEAKQTHPSQLGVVDPVHTPEGSRSGISTHLSLGVSKRGKDPVIRVYDLKNKEWVDRSPREMRKSLIAFPDQYDMTGDKPVLRPGQKTIVAVSPGGGDPQKVDPDKADYVLRSPKAMFSYSANLVPFLASVQANRAEMATRHIEQTVPLKDRQEPLVQSATGSDRAGLTSWEKIIGKQHSHRAPVDGTVTSVTPNAIMIKDSRGKSFAISLYDNFPLNEKKAFVHSQPTVKPGDKVTAGDTIADTNFTKNGVLALGTNLRLAYLAYRGGTFEDGVIVSESAAKKLTSEHLSKERLFADTDTIFDTRKFRSNFASVITDENAKKLDDNGVIRKGSVVKPGDTLIAAMKKSDPSPEQLMLKGVHRALAKPYKDMSVSWDRDISGVVTDISRNGRETVVYVKTEEPATVADKVSGRFGNKGVISQVLPDSEMPLDKDGNPLEIIVNPSGVPGRINPAQVLETSVSNAAAKAGVVVEANSFEEDPDKRIALSPTAGPIEVAGHYRTIHTKDGVKRVWVKPHERDREKGFYGSVNSFLKQTGASETTELFDPVTKKSLGDVLVGYQYIHKHMHQVDKKLNVRAHGHGFAYDANLVPRGSGNHDGAQRYGELGLYAMLAHGATANIREGLTWKSNRDQDEVWTAIQTGQPLPMPKSSFAYSKFLAYLNAVGLNIEREGDNLRVLPLTDKQTLEMSSGALTDASRVIRGKDMAVEKGGLFDPKITGGIGGKKWSHISLGEGIPNPIFEPAITSILGLTGKDYDAILAGNKDLDGKTGPAAVVEAISKIDVDKELAAAEESVKTARKDALNRANSRVKYLRMLKTNNMKASDAYVMNNLAVLPPVFRPVSAMESGDLNIDGLNLLYREVAMISQQLARSKGVLPEKEVAKLRGDLYNATSALVGMTGEDGQLSDGVTRPPGVLGVISGKIPKESFFHKRLLDRKQDVTARSVIVPDMTLTLDQISIPRKAGLTLYRPFVVKELVSMGFTPLSARAEIDKGTPLAKRALEVAASKRPVLFKRDPVLHKYGIQAFKPVFRDGAAIGIHPLAVGGFNADFDGDQMALFVPISQEAVEEAYRMMPSRNVFSPSTGKVMYTPTLEGQLGLYLISMFGKDSGRSAATLEDAAKLGDSGVVSYTDAITVGGKKTTAGRAKVYLALPESARADELLHDPKYLINKGKLSAMLTTVGKKENGDTFAQTADKLKNIGFGYAHSSGFSFSLSDFDSLSDIRDKHMKAAETVASSIRANKLLLPKERDEKVIAAYLEATKKIDSEAKEALAARGSKLLTMNAAGVKPDWGQLKQLVVSPGLVENASGRTVPVPISRSYSEGVTAADYITASEGARKGLIEKVQSVQEPGALTKQIINTAIPYVVSKQDCNTTSGISLDVDDPEIVDRYLAKPMSIGTRILAANTLVTPTIAAELKASGTGKVVVRSPLKCTAAKGLCAHCYGAMDDGRPPKVGTNIGVIAGQAIGERGTQLAMKAFHFGGVVGSGNATLNALDRVTQLLQMPETLPGKATISAVDGKITKVEKSQLGGFNVFVGDRDHYVPGGRTLLVKAGDDVTRGRPISSGPVSPRDLLEVTDLDRVQRYMSDELYDAYRGEGVKRQNAEVVIRAITDLGVVDDPGDVGGAQGSVRGDMMSLAYANDLNKNGKGTPIEIKPILRGVGTLPLDRSTDFLARMQYRRLKDTMINAANRGWTSDIHDLHPVPGIVYSSEFGRKDKVRGEGPY